MMTVFGRRVVEAIEYHVQWKFHCRVALIPSNFCLAIDTCMCVCVFVHKHRGLGHYPRHEDTYMFKTLYSPLGGTYLFYRVCSLFIHLKTDDCHLILAYVCLQVPAEKVHEPWTLTDAEQEKYGVKVCINMCTHVPWLTSVIV
jgi:hypothetical protein